jgi:short-subunit dehydrogenase
MIEILINKNCFLTGATGGLGRQIAYSLISQNCNLFLTSKNELKLKKLVNDLKKRNDSITIKYKAANLENSDDVDNIIKDVKTKSFSIDILINCAGIFPVKSISKSKSLDFDSCFSINVRAPFFFAKEFSKNMSSKKWGRIINIASSSAYDGFENTSIYSASKHALLGLSRSLDKELKSKNIRTICISPGSIKTKMGKKVPNQNYETFMNPKEIASLIISLISYDNEMTINEIRLNRMVIE